MNRLLAWTLLALLLSPAAVSAQKFVANYDESKVPDYKLPDPLRLVSGQPVRTARKWTRKRRPEILRLFQEQVYGKAPGRPAKMVFRLLESSGKALGGKAVRKQVRVLFAGTDKGPRMDLLVYLPAKATAAVPVFVGLNFNGNHAIHSDPAIHLAQSWHRDNAEQGYVNNRATEKSRGLSASRWAVERCLAAGMGVATIYCGDVDPDYHDEFHNGVHPLFYKDGQKAPLADQWGTIAAWAWGLSRALDYFESDKQIDQQRVILLGHSRLGKTALWAGARDQRFAIVISNNSGCGGAALSRRRFGETVWRINNSFPHWFCGNFKKFDNKENQLPVDQHMLLALVAPRPVYIASATGDRWADPRGEFLSALHAEPVYKLLGTEGLGTAKMPKADSPVHGRIGYHLRTGPHDVTDYDWQQYIAFARKHFGRK
ncbi:MAG: acetylxylan esterase [Planctomycetaceae bacterium]